MMSLFLHQNLSPQVPSKPSNCGGSYGCSPGTNSYIEATDSFNKIIVPVAADGSWSLFGKSSVEIVMNICTDSSLRSKEMENSSHLLKFFMMRSKMVN
jgi:hypothetical protein